MTNSFKRETSRTFVVAPDFPVIVALCVESKLQETLRSYYKSERDSKKIVLVLSEDFSADLNTNHIALADELFVINPSGQYDDFTSAMILTAQSLGKFVRTLKD